MKIQLVIDPFEFCDPPVQLLEFNALETQLLDLPVEFLLAPAELITNTLQSGRIVPGIAPRDVCRVLQDPVILTDANELEQYGYAS